MSDAFHPHHRFNFDPTINLGHILSVVMTLGAVIAGYTSLDARVAALEREARAEKVDHKETVVNVETRMMTRINEERARLDQTQVRTADDIREMKQIMRDGFKDLKTDIDRKQDKPGR